MNYLIDTHALLWSMYREELLSDTARDIIENTDTLFVSIVSFWEIAIKQSLDKLEFKQSITDIATECMRQSIQILDIKPQHCELVRSLPMLHSDPFDRMIIAQAIATNLSIITKDVKIHKYPITCIW